MKYQLLFLNICLLFFHFSCEEELQVPIPDEEPKLVINSLLGVDSLLRVHVSKSSVFQEQSSNTFLPDANIIIKENNQLLGKMIHENDGWYSLNSYTVKAGNSYQIEVSYPDLGTAESETKTLQKAAITNLSYQIKEENKLEFTFQFDDEALQENYYMILLKAYNGTSFSDIDFYSDNIIFNGNLSGNSIGIQQNMLRGSHTFSDENIDGETNSISIYAFNELFNDSEVNQEYKLELYHITSDYFKYERSLTAYYNRDDSPFYKKVNLHSNVSCGYGIFTSYAIDSKTITIQ
ncbi:hypothetical protein BZG01_01105 [Labilibaculum manganireducens]|uniref:DUF4249 domain-containing protein n=1 Tax=Labilibaculum manganireducens TaxID=1940525 RepID=A0A2N3IGW6_9BACT|nr:DUF4249 domain-containing protein [Labilibaculum manganireducens]PKQ69554.1 hypothetical protein BZG01_01105 [Labilibaculum manganireducens]